MSLPKPMHHGSNTLEAVPAQFSQTKEDIDSKLAGEAENDDSGEALLQAMNCKNVRGQSLHTCSMVDLIQGEIGADQGVTKPNPNDEEATKAAESKCIRSYMAKGLSSSDPRVIDGVGKNALTPPPQKPCWLKFVEAQCGLFSRLLWTGGILCFIAYVLDNSSPDNLYLGTVLFLVVFATGVFEFMQEAKSGAVMEGFANMLPPEVIVTRDGKQQRVQSVNLVVGDVCTINMGDKIPADLRMLEVTNLKVEQSSLTGEPDAIGKSVSKSHENPLESPNVAFFGTSAEAGSCTAIVVLVGDGTIMGNIAKLAAKGDVPPTPINVEIHRFIYIVSTIAILLGVTFGIVCFAQDQPIINTLVFVIGIIVANVPEGLLATVTVSLTLTAMRLSKKAVNVKDLEGVETLGSTSCICSDKTGTLTQNRMTSNHIYVEFANPTTKSHVYEVNAITSSTNGDPLPSFDFNDVALKKLLWCCNLVNATVFEKGLVGTGEENMGRYIQARECANGNASDIAFFKFAEGIFWKQGLKSEESSAAEATRESNPVASCDKEGAEQKLIIPFNSKYKFMVSVNWVQDGDKLRPAVLMKGAAEQIFQRCATYVAGEDVKPIDQDKVEHFKNTYNKFGGAGERVIGFAMKFLDEDSTYNCVRNETGSDTMTANGVVFDTSGEPINPDDAGYYPIGSKQFLDWGGQDNSTGCMEKDSSPPTTPAFDGLTFCGLISLIDPPREAVPGSVLLCRKAGVKVVMVTGDHPLTAAAIAKKVNIIQETAMTATEYMNFHNLPDEATAIKAAAAEYAALPQTDKDSDAYKHMRYVQTTIEAKVIPGWELKTMTPDQIKEAFMYRDLVFARTSPEQKLKIVNAAQDMGHVVAVTGDGVNDSPALRGADIGCAMGIAGTEVSKEAADMILMTDDFSAIVDGIEEGRLIFDNLKKSIAYTLSSNIPEISPFLMYIIIQMPLSLTTVLILCVDLGTDMIPAISLAYEKAESDIMERPPRDKDEDHLVTVKLVSFAYLQIGVFQALAGFYSFFVVMNDYGFKMSTIPKAANLVVPFPSQTGMSRGGKSHSQCSCGGGAPMKFIDQGKGLVSPVEADFGMKIIDGMLDTTSTKGKPKFEAFKKKAGGRKNAYKLLDEYCPYWNGTASDQSVRKHNKMIGSLKEDSQVYDQSTGMPEKFQEGLGRYTAPNWPFSWGCQYGALKPTKVCKFPDVEFNSKNPCYKGSEALGHAQTAAFVSIVIVQWADLVICKTRKLSIYHQGMSNTVMLFGLFSETVLCCLLAYVPFVHVAIKTRDIMFVHWMPSMPYSLLIFLYDETRKYIIRRHNRQNKDTPNQVGWLEQYTYY